MATFPNSHLPPEQALELHQRLLEGDPVAPSDLAVAYLGYLAGWLTSTNPRAEESACYDAAEDAIISLIKHPGSYKPERATLDAYLRMSASADLKNVLRAERRHSSRRADWGAVELSAEAGKRIRDEEADPARIAERRETVAELAKTRGRVATSVLEGLTPREVKVLELMTIKERKTEMYAEALGIVHLPAAEQQREVKRVKDRLSKKMERVGSRHE